MMADDQFLYSTGETLPQKLIHAGFVLSHFDSYKASLT